MGQIVSSQSSLIPLDWGAELAKLQSNVPPFPSEEVREVIYEELGALPEELYAHFEPEPFAAASTAQVHRALLHDGAEVVVKVQRPGIRRQMRSDLGIMQSASAVITRRSEEVRAIDLCGMIDQFGTNVLAELDYGNEAYNAHRLADNLASIQGVRVPQIYPHLSSGRVLTMEFVHGVKISNIAAIEQAGLDRRILASVAMRAFIKMLLIDGFFHADPHPGNVMVNLDSGCIYLLDCGMVGELDLNLRVNVIQSLLAAQQRDATALAQILLSVSTPINGTLDEKAYYRDFERRLGRIMYGNQDPDFAVVVAEGLDLLRQHGLRLDSNLTMAMKTLMQTEASASLLFPEGGMVSEGMAIVKELAFEAITPQKVQEAVTKQAGMVLREAVSNLPDLQEVAGKWLKQLQKGRLEVYVDTTGVAKEALRLNRLGRQLVIAIVLVGMIIGSAIATAFMASPNAPTDGYWLFIGRVAYLGYLLAMAAAAFLGVRLIWRWWRGLEE
jgi:ubiquinone biosynthesis protein